MGRRGTVFLLSSVHWHFTWQRHHEIASRLAAEGFAVVFIEPIPKRWPGWREARRVWGRVTHRHTVAGGVPQREPHGVTISSPLLVPDTNAAARRVNGWLVRLAVRRLRARFPDRPRIVIHYLPLAAALAAQHELQPDLAVYDCVSSWPEDPFARQSALREDALVDAMDVVFADAPYQVARMRQRTDPVVELLPAVDFQRWAPARAEPPGGELPVCAFFGTIGANIDIELVRRLSWTFPLRLIGPVQVSPQPLGPRAELLGPVPQQRLPRLLADVDVVLLPYRTHGHARGVIPAKTFECLATGRPVVATALPSLRAYSELFTICDTHDEFLAAIERVRDDMPADRDARLAAARANDWNVRIGELLATLDEALAAKAIDD